jgi:hypothetical protein
MKKYILLLPFLLIMFLSGCSADSDTAAANTDGTGGSLAVFVLKGNYLYAVVSLSAEQPLKNIISRNGNNSIYFFMICLLFKLPVNYYLIIV